MKIGPPYASIPGRTHAIRTARVVPDPSLINTDSRSLARLPIVVEILDFLEPNKLKTIIFLVPKPPFYYDIQITVFILKNYILRKTPVEKLGIFEAARRAAGPD